MYSCLRLPCRQAQAEPLELATDTSSTPSTKPVAAAPPLVSSDLFVDGQDYAYYPPVGFDYYDIPIVTRGASAYLLKRKLPQAITPPPCWFERIPLIRAWTVSRSGFSAGDAHNPTPSLSCAHHRPRPCPGAQPHSLSLCGPGRQLVGGHAERTKPGIQSHTGV
jgi:hypothetical protein